MCHRARALNAIVLALVASAIGCSSKTEQPPALVELLPHFQAGDRLTFERIVTKKQIDPGSRGLNVEARTDLDVRVLEAIPGGYVLELVYGETKVTPLDDATRAAMSQPLAAAMLRAMANLAKGVRIEVQLDRSAHVQGVKNFDEIKTITNDVIEAMVAEYEKTSGQQAEAAKMRAVLQSMLASREVVEQSWLQDIRLLLGPLGETYRTGTPRVVDSQFPNPFGGSAIAAKVESQLTSANNSTVTLSVKQSVDPISAQDAVYAMMSQMAQSAGRPPIEKSELFGIEMRDDSVYTIDRTTGWPESAVQNRTIKIPGADGSLQITEIKRKAK
jgi:hypothetical protein